MPSNTTGKAQKLRTPRRIASTQLSKTLFILIISVSCISPVHAESFCNNAFKRVFYSPLFQPGQYLPDPNALLKVHNHQKLNQKVLKRTFLITSNFLWTTLKIGTKVLLPLPQSLSFPAFRWHQKIAIKQYKNPSLRLSDLSAEEQHKLELHEMTFAFEQRREFLLANQGRARIVRALWRTHQAITTLSYFAAITLLLNQSEEDYLSLEDIRNDYFHSGGKKYGPGPHQIQIIMDFVPHPHLTLRIGESIYNYDSNRMTIMPFAQYFVAPHLNKLHSHLNSLASIHPHGLQIATLNIGEANVQAMETYLRQQENKLYTNVSQALSTNIFSANDCATMIHRDLRAFTSFNSPLSPLFDASPSQTMMYFSMLKVSGDPRVESLHTVMQEKSDQLKLHQARNFIVNNAESKIFLNPYIFSLNQAQRFVSEWNAKFKGEKSPLFQTPNELEAISKTAEELSQDFMSLDREHRLSILADIYRYSDAETRAEDFLAYKRRAQEILTLKQPLLKELPEMDRRILQAKLDRLELSLKNPSLLLFD